jgi:hypothetical protein
VCFSGDDHLTSPHDPEYLGDVAQAARSLPLERRPQILFRRCPVDDGSRYSGVLRRFPEIAVSEPIWKAPNGDWSRAVPTPEDGLLLANLGAHCDAVVNVGSTMALDFAVFDKPAIFIAYEPSVPDPYWTAAAIYRMAHFRSVHALQPVHWARSREELPDLLLQTTQHPAEKSQARKAWLELLVQHPLEGASRRCAEALRLLAGSPAETLAPADGAPIELVGR